MRILIIEGSQSPPTFVCNLIDALLMSGIEVGLFGKLRESNFVPKQASGFTRLVSDYATDRKLRLIGNVAAAFLKPTLAVKAFNCLSGYRKGKKSRLLDMAILVKIFDYNPDVIHFQWAAHCLDYNHLIKYGKYKFVVSLRGMHINVSPIIKPELGDQYRELFPMIDRFHAVSNRIAKEAQKYNGSPDKIEIIYSMLSDRFIEQFKEENNPLRKPISLLSIGRFHWQKGYRYGIETVYKLKQRGVYINYTIVAGNEIPEEELYLVNQFNIKDQVRFFDKVDYNEVPDLMTKHSALLLPSIAEGIANVVLEAMAVGLPVISCDIGGMSEVIINKQTGWLVPMGRPDLLADAVIDYSNTDEVTLREIRTKAHLWVRENNDPQKQALKFVSLYKSVI